MLATRPRYVLIAETEPAAAPSRWRFALHSVSGDATVAACDDEPQESPERLELLAVVRGLEAIEQPACVTLVTRSRLVLRGITRDLAEWRSAHWRWERFGRMTPIRHADLWRRISHALEIHQVQCRAWGVDRPGAARAGQPRPTVTAGPRMRESVRPTHRGGWQCDSPAMVIVPSNRTKRVVRLAEQAGAPQTLAG